MEVSKKLYYWLYILFVITLIPGAKILSLKIGFFTIYPNFLVLLAGTIISLFNFKEMIKVYKGVSLLGLGFLLIWILYAVIQYSYVGYNENYKIDLRSLLFFLGFYHFLHYMYFGLGKTKFVELTKTGLTALYLSLVIIGFFEIETGVHILGGFTEKMDLDIKSPIIYSPLGFVDNPNTFLVYIYLLTGMMMLVETLSETKKQAFKNIVLILIVYYFSVRSLSRMGVYLSYFMMCFEGVRLAYEIIKQKRYSNKTIVISTTVLLSVSTFIIVPKYYGPIWQEVPPKIILKRNGEIYNVREGGLILNSDLENFDIDTIEKYYGSNRIRKSLFFNGLLMLEESKYLGVGPGQYRELTAKQKVKYYTTTNVGTHFGLVEVLSQYGVIIVVLIVLLFVYILSIIPFTFSKLKLKEQVSYYMQLLFLLAGTSILSSGFIVLDINWITFFLLVFVAQNWLNQKKASYERV